MTDALPLNTQRPARGPRTREEDRDMSKPTHILVDRSSVRRAWDFRGAFYNIADALLTAARLGDISYGDPVEYQILRWKDWTIAAEGMSQSIRTARERAA